MKKLLSNLLLITLSIAAVSCDKNNNENVTLDQEVKVIVPYGTPYMGLGGLLGTENLTIDAVQGADNLKTALVNNEYDIVVAPINLGAQLFNKGNSAYKVGAVLTMNNAYLVSKNNASLDSLADVEGKDVLAFGQTGVPGSLLKKLYTDNNYDISKIDYTLASSAACYTSFVTSDKDYALLSEPEISKLKINDKIDVKTLDLCGLIDGNLPQASIFVKVTSDNSNIDKALKLIEDNVGYLNSNSSEYANKILPLDRTFQAMGSEVLTACLPNANIVYNSVKNESTKADIANVLGLLGVQVPTDEFYY